MPDLQLPPSSTGPKVDQQTTVAGYVRQVNIPPYTGQFNVVSTPGAAAQASASQAAGAGSVRNVATMISFCLATGANPQTAIHIFLRDGASGVGTILWALTLILPANSILAKSIPLPHIQGSAATVMTAEFDAAGVALSYESVSLNGYTTA